MHAPTLRFRNTIGSRRALTGIASIGVLALAASGCAVTRDSAATDADSPSNSHQPSTKTSATAQVSQVRFSSNIAPAATQVRVDKTYRLRVSDGTLKDVALTSQGKTLKGTMTSDKLGWASATALEPGKTYHVTGTAIDTAGVDRAYRSTFTTKNLRLNQQTYPSFSPPPGATVGIAMPVIVHFDVPVTNKASIQRHLQVTSSPAQAGAWHWISDNEVHWRPKHYWKAGTTVTVKADINSVRAGNGIFGQLNRSETFHIGRDVIDRVNIATDELRQYENGRLVRTIPVTTGQQPEFTTRSGVKVIVQKYPTIDMNSGTIGIDPNSPQGYNLKDVEFAMRLTYSGEFLHAAPWSVYAQGHENVSHGCTGMSTANAEWLFDHSLVGDPVVFTGSNKPMTLDNGYGDWNEPFAEYAKGSAL